MKPAEAQQLTIVATDMITSAMHVARVDVLFWWFLLILKKFWHGTSCIEKVISLPFYAYAECQKWSSDGILTSILIWMWPCHSSHHAHGYCEHIVLLIQDEFWHVTSENGNVISLPFYAYVEHLKWSPDAILMSILVWVWPCHRCHEHDVVIMPVATVNILF
jgi:hypothetical protein